MKTVSIILRQNGFVHFVGQEASRQHRAHGVVVADASEENAQRLIQSGLADPYFPGQTRRSVEFLDPAHPLSRNQIYLRRQAEEAFLIRAALAAQQPQ
jgi:hypothetical protein